MRSIAQSHLSKEVRDGFTSSENPFLDTLLLLDPASEKYLDTIASFGVEAVRQHVRISDQPPALLDLPPKFPWINTAREIVSSYVEEDFDARVGLLGTAFFSEDDKIQRSLNALVFGSVKRLDT